MKNNATTSKDKILKEAWELFVMQGYEQTTVNQIIEKSGTSKGSFYHHYTGKDELLFHLAYRLDEKYSVWLNEVDKDLNPIEKLLSFNNLVLKILEEYPHRDLLPMLYGLQVMTDNKQHINNKNRLYYKIVSDLMKECLEKGFLSDDYSYLELTEDYVVIQRGLTYDWCLNKHKYSLQHYGKRIISTFLRGMQIKQY